MPWPNGPAARDTGISTYVWILDNKPAKGKGNGKVINAADMFHTMRKSLAPRVSTCDLRTSTTSVT